jgi:hypothetical protein
MVIMSIAINIIDTHRIHLKGGGRRRRKRLNYHRGTEGTEILNAF